METHDDHPAKSLFEIDKVNCTAICLVDVTCPQNKKPMKAGHSGNLLRHLKNRHKSQYEEAKALVMERDGNGKAKKRRHPDDTAIKMFSYTFKKFCFF
jgi:hypothetical protein